MLTQVPNRLTSKIGQLKYKGNVANDIEKGTRFLGFCLERDCDWSVPPVRHTDYQYQTAAQVLDQRAAVGLARTPQVDRRFFLSPPTLPNTEDVRLLTIGNVIS